LSKIIGPRRAGLKPIKRDDRRRSRQDPTTRAMTKHIHEEWDSEAHARSKILTN